MPYVSGSGKVHLTGACCLRFSPLTISASETLIRYLGPSEAYFWLSNQNSWKHFVVAAQIKGETTTASWRTALDAVQRRHPLLGVWTRTTAVPRFFASFPSCVFHFG